MRQLTEAFPWDDAPRYLIRDRDRVYGAAVARRLRAMGIRDKPIAPGSPWQNGVAERLIGSIRRACTDHVVAFGEGHLRRSPAILRALLQCSEDSSLTEQRRTFSSADREPRCHHFTASSRWTLQPVLPNLIFGTHR